MSDRWIPVLAAIVGVLGGMGGALVGGYVANQGQEQRSDSEREAARHDLRQDAYATYLEAANTLVLTGQLVKVHPDDVSDANIDNAINAAFSAQATVELLAPTEVRKATTELTNLLGHDREEWTNLSKEDWDEILQKRKDFINLAQKELATKTGG